MLLVIFVYRYEQNTHINMIAGALQHQALRHLRYSAELVEDGNVEMIHTACMYLSMKMPSELEATFVVCIVSFLESLHLHGMHNWLHHALKILKLNQQRYSKCFAYLCSGEMRKFFEMDKIDVKAAAAMCSDPHDKKFVKEMWSCMALA